MRVFISSTYEDLLPERDAITALGARLKASFVGMEIFSSSSQTPLEVALQYVSQCDTAVFVIAHRYGSIDEESGKSYVQLEYECAARMNKEILVYIKADSALIKISQVDIKHSDKLFEFRASLERHHYRTFKTPEELALFVALDVLDRLASVGRWQGIGPRVHNKYRQFWDQTFSGNPVALVMEIGKYPAHIGEVEDAKNINGVLGVAALVPALGQLGINVTLEPAVEGLALNRNLILDGSHTGNRITRRAVNMPQLRGRLHYVNNHADDWSERWLQNIHDQTERFQTVYKTENNVKKLSYDYGFLARVRNPFGPSGRCIIASGNHGAGTYACMKLLSSPDLLAGLAEKVGDADFQAVVGIEYGAPFMLGDPIIHKTVVLD